MANVALPAGFKFPTDSKILEKVDHASVAEILAPENRDRLLSLLVAQSRAHELLEESAIRSVCFICVSPENLVQLVEFELDLKSIEGGVWYTELWTFGTLAQ